MLSRRVRAELADLADDVRAEVVEHLAELIEASGADTSAAVDDVLRAWLADEPVLPSDDPAWAAFAARTEVDLERLAAVVAELQTLAAAEALPDGLTDTQILDAVMAAEAASRVAMSLRGTGMRALREQVLAPVPEGAGPEPGRERTLRRLARRKLSRLPVRVDSDVQEVALAEADRALLAETFAVTESALVLGVSERAAGAMWDVHAALADLPVTAAGLRCGDLEWAKAKTVADLLVGRPPAVRQAVDERIVPYARTGPAQRYRTVPALRDAIKALLLQLDPPEPDDTDGERDRRRVWARPAPTTAPGTEGMGELVAYLPLADVARITARLDAAAAQARRDRDPRTADQVRADLLTDLLVGGSLGAGPQVTAQVLVTMTLETLLGLTAADPAHLHHYGPVAADVARDLAANATFRCALVDGEHGTILGLGRGTHREGYTPGPRLQDLQRTTWQRCSFPGCSARVDRGGPTLADLDHIVPWPAGPTCACNTHPLCRRHHRLKTFGRIDLEHSTDPADPPGTMHWRLPSGRTHTSRPEPATPAAPPPPEPAPAAARCYRPPTDGPPPY